MKKLYLLFMVSLFVPLLCGYVDLREGRSKEGQMLLCRTISAIIAQNQMNVSNLSSGMPKEEVLKAMENRGLIAYQDGEQITVANPSKTETLQGKEKKIEVLYYMTESVNGDYTVTDDKLTPLVFEDNLLIGWGRDFLQGIIRKYEIERK
ncbi:MAG: DUF3192 domain-containing protein [Candidatus Omnitrophota bacterium]